MNVGHLPDDTVIKTLGSGIVCTQCGHLGADVVPELADPFRAALILIIRPSARPSRLRVILKPSLDSDFARQGDRPIATLTIAESQAIGPI